MSLVSELFQERIKGRYISAAGLRNLANYGYHGEDRSFFGNWILKHWWNWVVERVPLWFAPNLLTLLGLFCNIFAYVIFALYTPHLTEEVPRWACFVGAISLFAYQTLDNVDGKQARRTGSSSPLGELFDHGCDSITMGMLALMVGGVVRMGGVLTLIGLIVGWGPFYLAHWEEYHTGILIMGKWNGPTEAQLIVMVTFVFTGIVGPWVWVAKLFTIGDHEIHLNHFMFLFTVIFSLITIGQNVHKVLSLSTRVMPFLPTLFQLVPFTILVFSSILWGGTEHVLLNAHPHVVMMVLSLVFAYLTSRLIVNRVCKEPTQHFHGILAPLIIIAISGLIGAVRRAHKFDFIFAVILLVLSGLQFLFFSVCIIRQLTSHLGIHAFTIVPVDPNSRPPPPLPQQGVASPLLEDGVASEIDLGSVDEGAHSIE